ncbi:MAG: ArnT family glycosyltransferase [Promethearchaeota archaeon]
MESLSTEQFKIKIKEHKELLLILILSIIIRLLFLNRPELQSRDEGVHAVVAQSLLINPLKPILIAKPIPGLENIREFPHIFLEKPPLIFWLMALSYKIFGVNEFAVRFVPAVFGIISILLTYVLAKQFFEKKIALLSALLLSLCQFHVKYSRQGMLDVPLTFFSLLTLFLFIKGFNSKSSSSILFVLAGVSQGLGILTKWHAAIFPTVTILLFVCLQKKWEFLFSRKIAFYFISVVLSTLPWLVYMYVSFPEATRALILFELGGRPSYVSSRGPFWYFSMLMWGLTPWAPITLISVFYSAWKRSSGDLFLLLISGTTFFTFELSSYKLYFYILPIIPFLLILTARFIFKIILLKEKTILLFAVSLIGSFVYISLKGVFPNTLFGIDQLLFLLIVSAGVGLYYIAIWFYDNKMNNSYPIKSGLLLLLIPLFISNLTFTGVDIYTEVSYGDLGIKEISAYIRNHSSEDDYVFSTAGLGWSIMFYAERSTYEFHVVPREIFENYILTKQVKFIVISEEFLSSTNQKVNFVLTHSVEVNILGVSPSLHVYSIV